MPVLALYRCDVSNAEEVDACVKQVLADFGSVWTLVNNAGVTADGLLLRMSEDDFDRVIKVNLKGTFLMTKALTRQFMRQRGGHIINVSSVVGVMGNAGQANYAASKAGVIGFTKSVARELAGRGVTANVVAPGFVRTDMTAKLSDSIIASYEGQIPLAASVTQMPSRMLLHFSRATQQTTSPVWFCPSMAE